MDNHSLERARSGEADAAGRRLGTGSPLVCLNFKVPLRVRQQLKIHAARHNMTMTELLLQLVADKLSHDEDSSQPRARER
ncbi:MAG: hypothetical protein JWL65_965 [Gammaproteobacteria bacterium]|nr:hypothetical protein [Gammaproteobacteria bacterium]